MRRTGQGPTGSPGPGSQRFGTQDQDQARQGCMLLSVRPRCPPLWPVIVVLPNWPAAGLLLSPPRVFCIHCPIKGARHRAALSRFFLIAHLFLRQRNLDASQEMTRGL